MMTSNEPKTCYCGGVALRHVGRRGFCKLHIPEAFEAAAEAKQMQQSIAGLLALDHQRRRIDEGELAARRHRS